MRPLLPLLQLFTLFFCLYLIEGRRTVTFYDYGFYGSEDRICSDRYQYLIEPYDNANQVFGDGDTITVRCRLGCKENAVHKEDPCPSVTTMGFGLSTGVLDLYNMSSPRVFVENSTSGRVNALFNISADELPNGISAVYCGCGCFACSKLRSRALYLKVKDSAAPTKPSRPVQGTKTVKTNYVTWKRPATPGRYRYKVIYTRVPVSANSRGSSSVYDPTYRWVPQIKRHVHIVYTNSAALVHAVPATMYVVSVYAEVNGTNRWSRISRPGFFKTPDPRQ